MNGAIIKIGTKINLLTIIHDLGVINKNRRVIATCECGVTKEYFYSSLKTGNTQSCGCIKKERITQSVAKHLLCYHKIYKLWVGMKNRCYCENNTNYSYYGGRGVVVCDEWRNDFTRFYEWAVSNGWQEGLQLDKDKLSPYTVGVVYSPEYCSFLSSKENCRHTRRSKILIYNGEKKSLSSWCDLMNLSYKVMERRINLLKWSVEKAFETPKNKYTK